MFDRRVIVTAAFAAACLMGLTSPASAQSNSLYLQQPAPPQRERGRVVDPRLQHASYTAVLLPEPRQFAVNDLVTIIVRESASASASAGMNTEKEMSVEGSIEAFPNLDLRDLLELQLNQSTIDGDNTPAVDVSLNNEFEGEGDYERRDDLVLRLTARIADVKPNGTLALEARKFIRNDEESLEVKLTGYCRAEDVTAGNTVLSTQLHNLHIEKVHDGELRKATKKGLLTKVFELLFNF